MTLETLKTELDITWQDEKTDRRLSDILSRAESVLNGYAGAELDFSDESTAEAQLLLDCCRYMWEHAFDDFKKNYADELIMLRANRAVKDHADEENTDLQ